MEEAKEMTKAVLTEEKLQEHLKNLQIQLQEATQKTLMLKGAIETVSLQIQELNEPVEGESVDD